jgi:hypothetical protein
MTEPARLNELEVMTEVVWKPGRSRPLPTNRATAMINNRRLASLTGPMLGMVLASAASVEGGVTIIRNPDPQPEPKKPEPERRRYRPDMAG